MHAHPILTVLILAGLVPSALIVGNYLARMLSAMSEGTWRDDASAAAGDSTFHGTWGGHDCGSAGHDGGGSSGCSH